MLTDIILSHAARDHERRTALYQETHKDEPLRLHPSSLGMCVRKTYISAMQSNLGKTPYFSDETLVLFRLGRMYENETAKALAERFSPHIAREWPVRDGIWSGRPDFVIARCEEYPNGAVIEHKATAPWNFSAGRIPKTRHMLQLLKTRDLVILTGNLDYKPVAILLYRGWGHTAQYTVEYEGDRIVYTGNIDRREDGAELELNFPELIERYESYFPAFVESGELPPGEFGEWCKNCDWRAECERRIFS